MRLGINIDHIATVRNARGGIHPDPVRAALMAQEAGADGITAHLREDRRHIRDDDMHRLKESLHIPLNFEMAATEEMQRMALLLRPHAVCLVPERREEITTEGGLDVARHQTSLRSFIAPLRDAGIRVSCFIEADMRQIDASQKIGAHCIELHTGAYAHASGAPRLALCAQIAQAAHYANTLGLEVHAGHGLDYDNTPAIAAIPIIKELNIGHFLMGEAMFHGVTKVVQHMKAIIATAVEKATEPTQSSSQGHE
ncbi:MAG: pyridoxine 5'-phosphate synthase [Alphaproteobacteria bacterium]|nr:MAG: pyridoxine 5'-phosphate synthase [Alphaproteobacteria bacterium]TAF14134.1 MAG: pyridoxine 5'-phosphate synthase [Alphaproteobacteria bacterium]